MLLATIAGCYSELGESQQAFAYMYQALREAGAGKSQGFDVVLYCNLAHELIQLGDYHQALSYLAGGPGALRAAEQRAAVQRAEHQPRHLPDQPGPRRPRPCPTCAACSRCRPTRTGAAR